MSSSSIASSAVKVTEITDITNKMTEYIINTLVFLFKTDTGKYLSNHLRNQVHVGRNFTMTRPEFGLIGAQRVGTSVLQTDISIHSHKCTDILIVLDHTTIYLSLQLAKITSLVLSSEPRQYFVRVNSSCHMKRNHTFSPNHFRLLICCPCSKGFQTHTALCPCFSPYKVRYLPTSSHTHPSSHPITPLPQSGKIPLFIRKMVISYA